MPLSANPSHHFLPSPARAQEKVWFVLTGIIGAEVKRLVRKASKDLQLSSICAVYLQACQDREKGDLQPGCLVRPKAQIAI